MAGLLRDPVGSTALSAHLLESCQQFSPQSFWNQVNAALQDLGVMEEGPWQRPAVVARSQP